MRNISTPFSPLKCYYLGIFEKEPPSGSFPIFYHLHLQSCWRLPECFQNHYLITFLNQSQDKVILPTLFNQGTLKMENEKDLPNVTEPVCEKQSMACPVAFVEHVLMHTSLSVLSRCNLALSTYSLSTPNRVSPTCSASALGFLSYLLFQ